MGKDLRIKRPQLAYERFLVYPANTNVKEILEHSAKPKGAFRGQGYGQELFRKDEFGNIMKTQMKSDGVQTSDKIDVMPDDLVYNTYSKELFIVESWENVEEDRQLQFSTRPSSTKLISLRKSGLDG